MFTKRQIPFLAPSPTTPQRIKNQLARKASLVDKPQTHPMDMDSTAPTAGITAAARTVAVVAPASAQTTLTALEQPETHKPMLPIQEPLGPNRTCLLCIYSFICFFLVFFCLLSLTILLTLTLSHPPQTHLTIPTFPLPLFFQAVHLFYYTAITTSPTSIQKKEPQPFLIFHAPCRIFKPC